MKSRTVARCAVAALLCTTALVACDSTTNSNSGNNKVLRTALFTEPTDLSPVSGNIITQDITAQLYPALLRYDEGVKAKPYLAEKWTVSSDSLTYTFNLNPAAKWTDGKAITSADVKFTFEELLPKYLAPAKLNYGDIKSIETPDEKTVIFKLKRPYAALIKLFGNAYATIVPKHIYEGTDPSKNGNSLNAAVTGGPFKFKSWDKGQSITLERNPDYFVQPKVDSLIFQFIPDESARILALKTGQLDYLGPGMIPYSSITSLKADGNLTVEPKGDEAAGKVLTMGFNTKRKPLDDVRVRRALTMAIDMNYVAKAVGQGHAKLALGPLNASSWAWDGSLKALPYDPAAAASLLDEAGYPKKGSGRFSIDVLNYSSVANFQKANAAVAESWKKLGITVNVKNMDNGPYYAATYVEKDFGVSSTAMKNAYDPSALWGLYSCNNIKPQPFSNFLSFCDQRVDTLLDKGRSETDDAKRKAVYKDLQQTLIDDAPALWVINWDDWSAWRKGVEGVPAGPWDAVDPLLDAHVAR